MKKDVMQAVADTGILPVINITDINDAEPLARAILGGVQALDISLGFELAHVGINHGSAEDGFNTASALSNGFSPQDQIEFAAAASCLKQTIELDVNLSSVSDILSLMGGNASGRVIR